MLPLLIDVDQRYLASQSGKVKNTMEYTIFKTALTDCMYANNVFFVKDYYVKDTRPFTRYVE